MPPRFSSTLIKTEPAGIPESGCSCYAGTSPSRAEFTRFQWISKRKVRRKNYASRELFQLQELRQIELSPTIWKPSSSYSNNPTGMCYCTFSPSQGKGFNVHYNHHRLRKQYKLIKSPCENGQHISQSPYLIQTQSSLDPWSFVIGTSRLASIMLTKPFQFIRTTSKYIFMTRVRLTLS